eukprot:scaffold2733_cov255-Pinguiococcus_pyrenoidosus.AAC.3
MLIAPCVIAGSFYYYSAERGGMFGTFAVIMTMVSFGVQSGALVVAGYYVERMLRENRDEIAAIPDDEEVTEADRRDERRYRQLQAATAWDRLVRMRQYFPAGILCGSAVLMVVSCWLATFLSDACFRTFELTDTVADKLDGQVFTIDGSAGITKPLGNVVLALFFISLLGYLWFVLWAARYAASQPGLLGRVEKVSPKARLPESLSTDLATSAFDESSKPRDAKIHPAHSPRSTS